MLTSVSMANLYKLVDIDTIVPQNRHRYPSTAGYSHYHHYAVSTINQALIFYCVFICIYFNRSPSDKHCGTCSSPELMMKRSSIDVKLEHRFKEKMRNDNVPLLKDYTTYCAHLPRRQIDYGQVLSLYELEYWVRPADLKRMSTNGIELCVPNARPTVRYISAPTGSGKTASILPAFLESPKATHYLYLPFDHNDKKYFRAKPYDIDAVDSTKAQKQGAAFMAQCVKNLLEGNGYGEIPVIDDVPSIGSIENDLKSYLQQKLGDGYRIWFHIDEHRKIIERDYPKNIRRQRAAAAFSKGAMTVLVGLYYCQVIATYEDPPTEVPSLGTDHVDCRYPIPLASLDIDQVMARVPELMSFNRTCINGAVEKRLWATLRFRLAMKIREELGIAYVLHRRGINEEVERFLFEFDTIAHGYDKLSPKDREEVLIKLNALCKPGKQLAGIVASSNKDAAKLLIGVYEDRRSSEWIFQKQLKSGLIVCDPYNLITCSLPRLLEMKDPDIPVYNQGRDLFREALWGTPDRCSATPLEHAYVWSLSSRSAVQGSLSLDDRLHFQIKCKWIEPKRLFDGDKELVNELEQNVIYYAKKPRDHENDCEMVQSDPIADIFFVSNDDELVLIDITGESDVDSIKSKISAKTKWIQNYRQNINQFCSQDGKSIKELRCIILAPNFDGDANRMTEEDVKLVFGTRALELLCGLSQIFHWMVEDNKSNDLSNNNSK